MKRAAKFVNELLKGNPDLAHLDPILIRSALRQFREIYSDDKHKIIRGAATALAKVHEEGVVGMYRDIERHMGQMSPETPGEQRKARTEGWIAEFVQYFPNLKGTEDSLVGAVLEQCEDIYPGNKRRVFIVAAIALQLCSEDNYQAYRDELTSRAHARDRARRAEGDQFLQLRALFNRALRGEMTY